MDDRVMSSISILIGISAAGGLALGFFRLHWIALVISGLIFAIAGAAVLQSDGFQFVPGVALIVGCLTVNQFAYLVGAASIIFTRNEPDLTGDQPDEPPGESGQHDIGSEHGQHDQSPSRSHPPCD
jgi:hypothetical protein